MSNDIKIPGVIWVILLLIIGVVIQANSLAIQATLHIPAGVVVAVVAVIFLVAKMLYPGTGPLNGLISLVERLIGSQQTKEAQDTTKPMPRGVIATPQATVIQPGEIPKRPNTWMRVLLG